MILHDEVAFHNSHLRSFCLALPVTYSNFALHTHLKPTQHIRHFWCHTLTAIMSVAEFISLVYPGNTGTEHK